MRFKTRVKLGITFAFRSTKSSGLICRKFPAAGGTVELKISLNYDKEDYFARYNQLIFAKYISGKFCSN